MYPDILTLRASERFALFERFVRYDRAPATRTFDAYIPLPWSCHSRTN